MLPNPVEILTDYVDFLQELEVFADELLKMSNTDQPQNQPNQPKAQQMLKWEVSSPSSSSASITSCLSNGDLFSLSQSQLDHPQKNDEIIKPESSDRNSSEKKRKNTPCKFFGTPRGCFRDSNTCRYSHEHPESIKICANYFSIGCNHGKKCRFRHFKHQTDNGLRKQQSLRDNFLHRFGTDEYFEKFLQIDPKPNHTIFDTQKKIIKKPKKRQLFKNIEDFKNL